MPTTRAELPHHDEILFDVTDEDIVLDVRIPAPPRVEAVVERDIVDELSAPTLFGPIDVVPNAIPVVPLPGVVASTPASRGLVRRKRHARRAVLAAFGFASVLGGIVLSRGTRATVGPSPTSNPVAAAPAPGPVDSLAELRARAHAVFAEGRALEALRLYDRVLERAPAAVDDRLIENLLACYGKKRVQPLAATIIVRYQLTEARPALHKLMRAGRTYGTRAGARYTLEKLRSERRPA